MFAPISYSLSLPKLEQRFLLLK